MACPNEIYFFHNFYNSFQKGSMNFQPTQIFLSSNLTYIPNGNLKLRALKRFPAVMTFLLLGWSFIQNIWSDNHSYVKIIYQSFNDSLFLLKAHKNQHSTTSKISSIFEMNCLALIFSLK